MLWKIPLRKKMSAEENSVEVSAGPDPSGGEPAASMRFSNHVSGSYARGPSAIVPQTQILVQLPAHPLQHCSQFILVHAQGIDIPRRWWRGKSGLANLLTLNWFTC